MSENIYQMDEFNFEYFPPTDDLGNLTEVNNTMRFINKNHDTWVSDLQGFDLKQEFNRGLASPTVLDVLILWTEDARVAAGGATNLPNDTSGIETLIITAVDHANTVFSNSQVNTRITAFHAAKYNNFQYSGDKFTDITNFREDLSIQATRNLVGADLVVAIVGNDFNQFNVCGVSHVQTYPTCSDGAPILGCNFGSRFEDAAYSMTAEFCTIWDDTFTHEIGHNLGANHVQGELNANFLTSVQNNGFSKPFGFYTTSLKTLMSINNTQTPSTSRRMYFSNPSITLDGTVIGTSTSDNSLVIDQLSPVMANYRTRPDLIFVSGFE